jgi:hypothetical protein
VIPWAHLWPDPEEVGKKIKGLLPRKRPALVVPTAAGWSCGCIPPRCRSQTAALVLKASCDRFPFQVPARRWVGERFLV